ncbi:hypothetical protein D3C84_807280 [compost metagenome]
MMPVSSSLICNFLGLSIISVVVANMPEPGRSLMTPADASTRSARPSLLGSLGTPMMAPSGKALTALNFFEYRPMGHTAVLPTGTI